MKELLASIDELPHVLKAYFNVLESVKGLTLQDPRHAHREDLANKIFAHAASAAVLSKGTDVRPLIGAGGWFYDHSSMTVLARVILEAYLAYCYVYVEPQTDDDFEYRHAIWQLSGGGALEHIPVAVGYEDAYEAVKRRNDELRKRIEGTKKYGELRPREQKLVMSGRSWRYGPKTYPSGSYGFAERYYTGIYGMLSAAVHSDSTGARGVIEARTASEQKEHAVFGLFVIMVVVSKMAMLYSENYEVASAALQADGAVFRLIQRLASVFSEDA